MREEKGRKVWKEQKREEKGRKANGMEAKNRDGMGWDGKGRVKVWCTFNKVAYFFFVSPYEASLDMYIVSFTCSYHVISCHVV